MNIKENLKRYGVTLNELAEFLDLSRPTLNNYINQYESGKIISNKAYNEVFKNLFENNTFTEEDFKKRLIKYSFNFQEKKKLETAYTAENLDLLNSITQKIREDLRGEVETSSLYKFINSAIHSYGKNPALTGYINYNLYLNSLKDITTIKYKDKNLISNLFPIMNSFVCSQLKYNKNGYNEFLERVEEIKKEREEKSTKLKKQIDDIKEQLEVKLKKEISKKIKQGVNIENLDIEEILRGIKLS